MIDEMRNIELNEEQLEDVTGGGYLSGNKYYSSGRAPMFQVGQRVIMQKAYYFFTKKYYVTILSVSSERNGSDQYTYSVLYDDGDTETNIYESQMLYRQSDGNWTPYTEL